MQLLNKYYFKFVNYSYFNYLINLKATINVYVLKSKHGPGSHGILWWAMGGPGQ